MVPMPGLRRRSFRVSVTMLVLLGQVLWVTGIPGSWLGIHLLKDRRVPFPCMDRPCGCRNADDCWQHCCCFSPAEHVAWSRQHGLSIPMGATTDQTESVGSRASSAPCHRREHSICAQCSVSPDDSADSCCPSAAEQCPACRSSEPANEGSAGLHAERHRSQTAYCWYHPVLAQRCRGELTVSWLQLLALPPKPDAEPWLETPFPEDTISLKQYVRSRCYRVPPDPPPRSGQLFA